MDQKRAAFVEQVDETVQARADEDRLQHAFRGGGFLVLTVKPSRMRDCERELLHRFSLENINKAFDVLVEGGAGRIVLEMDKSA